jgi:uncharacterized membrane protein YeaQ/YmgE (transglycosylase-associated protein family)
MNFVMSDPPHCRQAPEVNYEIHKFYLTYKLYHDTDQVKRNIERAQADGQGVEEENMNLEMFVTWALVGLLTGWLADFVMKDGGHGLISDLLLGLVGSSAANVMFSALGITPAPGQTVTAVAVVAFVGAAIAIVAQRKIGARA